MNIKRAKQEIKDTIETYFLKDEWGEYVIPSIRQRPILLLGSPGIGKTQIMEQIARECQIGLVSYTITHHTRQSAIGLPFISKKEYAGKEYAVTEYTMSEIVASIYEKMEQTGLKEGILFIDEINCVSETLAPAMLQFLQCKTFGNHEIPGGWLIVAAGNPPEYNKSVREFDVVTMDRIRKIEVEADFSVWKEYAYEHHLHPAVISYLNTKKQYFYQMETTVDGRSFATPRGWEDLSTLLAISEKTEKIVDREVVLQYIQHQKIAKDFANYLELFYKYRTDYQIEEIFKGNLNEQLMKKVAHASFDERLSVLGLLLSKVNEGIQNAVKKEREMEKLQGFLLQYKEKMTTEDSAVGILEQVIEKAKEEKEWKKGAGLLSREEEACYLNGIDCLEVYIQKLKMDTSLNPLESFEQIKSWFGEENETYLNVQRSAEKRLTYAFDFLEAAGLTGQEMVIFITELASNSGNVEFLKECEEERYFQYNKELLFLQKREKILEKL
ncbi:MAG: AAA family ATPase [Lachnospiraceae bacterium]|nr:AAA family ATPase [Lachnospiraceae bacterium]